MRLAVALKAALPAVSVVVAHELVPRIREYERTATVAAEAFLRPRVGRYVTRFARDAAQRGVQAPRVLASNGGALRADLAAERAVWLALSGPAGGIQGASLVGAASGFTDLLTLDMGGTSADAGVVIGGEASAAAYGNVAGVPVAVPHLAIETVSAGGGSIARLDSGGALRVGPESAGAVPGPACYGRGGTLPTVTDAYVSLGWIPDGSLLGGTVRVSRQSADAVIGALADAAGLALHACALGVVRVAEATMARALRRVSVERGLDPTHLTLVAFGGAGPLSGCALAELLGVRRVLLPPLAGALSALGMAAASDVSERSMAVHLGAGDFTTGGVGGMMAGTLAARLAADLPGAAVSFVAECRYAGQGYELDVPFAMESPQRLEADFHEAHLKAYGHKDAAAPVEVIELRAIGRARGAGNEGAPQRIVWPHAQERGRVTRQRIWSGSGATEADAAGYAWEGLLEGQTLAGPSIIEGRSATAFLPPGWSGKVNGIGAICAEPGGAAV
jgi:N-methylhydantoinase A